LAGPPHSLVVLVRAFGRRRLRPSARGRARGAGRLAAGGRAAGCDRQRRGRG
ncbi:unnamed protein product, partial [Durusdinium trenchii]